MPCHPPGLQRKKVFCIKALTPGKVSGQLKKRMAREGGTLQPEGGNRGKQKGFCSTRKGGEGPSIVAENQAGQEGAQTEKTVKTNRGSSMRLKKRERKTQSVCPGTAAFKESSERSRTRWFTKDRCCERANDEGRGERQKPLNSAAWSFPGTESLSWWSSTKRSGVLSSPLGEATSPGGRRGVTTLREKQR